MNIHESAEDYLEAILILRERQGAVRSIDVVRQLELTKPSVSVAMKKLRESGYIEMEPDGSIKLLPAGAAIAGQIYERHQTLTDFFVYLGVSEETASADACKVEHDLSPETFEKIKAHVRRTMERGDSEKTVGNLPEN